MSTTLCYDDQPWPAGYDGKKKVKTVYGMGIIYFKKGLDDAALIEIYKLVLNQTCIEIDEKISNKNSWVAYGSQYDMDLIKNHPQVVYVDFTTDKMRNQNPIHPASLDERYEEERKALENYKKEKDKKDREAQRSRRDKEWKDWEALKEKEEQEERKMLLGSSSSSKAYNGPVYKDFDDLDDFLDIDPVKEYTLHIKKVYASNTKYVKDVLDMIRLGSLIFDTHVHNGQIMVLGNEKDIKRLSKHFMVEKVERME